MHRAHAFRTKQFLVRHLIPESAMTRFDAATASVSRLRNSVLAELLLVALVYVFGILILWRHYVAFATATWYAAPSAEGSKLSLAGMWYGYISLPIFQFLLCRWYFRLFIWARFLWQVSRIDLSLVPTHPDRVCGLGFLSDKVYAFIPVLIAHGALLAGLLGNRIYHLGAKLPDFLLDILMVAIFLICVVLGPLFVFAPQLAQAKLIGKGEYGALAERYMRGFDVKWLRGGGAPADAPLLGNADIQSLADMGNSFQVVQTIRLVPFTREVILQLLAATLAPLAPLLLTMMPLEEFLKRLLGMLSRQTRLREGELGIVATPVCRSRHRLARGQVELPRAIGPYRQTLGWPPALANKLAPHRMECACPPFNPLRGFNLQRTVGPYIGSYRDDTSDERAVFHDSAGPVIVNWSKPPTSS